MSKNRLLPLPLNSAAACRFLLNLTPPHRPFHTLIPAGVEHPVTQSPKSIRKHWGPSRRHGRTPPSTARGHNREGRQPWCVNPTSSQNPYLRWNRAVNARVRERVTVRPIQPRRRASLSTVVVRKSEIFVMTRIFDSRTTQRTGRPMARPVRP